MDERSRHELHQKLDRVLGPDEATTLMSMLPPVGWADVATKRDLDALAADFRAELRAEVGGLRAELHEELGGLHGDIGGLRAELHEQVGGLRGGLHEQVGGLRAEFHRELSAATRTLMFGIFTSVVAVASLAFGAARLL